LNPTKSSAGPTTAAIAVTEQGGNNEGARRSKIPNNANETVLTF